MPGFETSPLADSLHSSEQPQAQDEDRKIANELSLFKSQYKNSVDYIVVDDGMEPLYKRNEYVAGISLAGKRIDEALGLNCIIQLENGNVLLRLLRKGAELDTYTLICLNTTQVDVPVLYNVKIEWVAPVIFHRKRNMLVT
jgi:HTH-type transcriptional regulator, cell division transcriptional repressor